MTGVQTCALPISGLFASRATPHAAFLASNRRDEARWAHYFVGNPRNIDILLRVFLLELHPTSRRRTRDSGSDRRLNRGFTLIEVLVTLVILMFGLLGIAGLMAKGQRASFEAYQRQAALSIANDMVERINVNRLASATYAAGATTAEPLGRGSVYETLLNGSLVNCGSSGCSGDQLAAYDLALWDGLLQGYGERNAGGPIGGIINARGCVEETANTAGVCPPAPAQPGNFFTRTNRVSVAWLGNEETAVPGSSTCGTGLYGTETRRRLVSLDIMVQLPCP